MSKIEKKPSNYIVMFVVLLFFAVITALAVDRLVIDPKQENLSVVDEALTEIVESYGSFTHDPLTAVDLRYMFETNGLDLAFLDDSESYYWYDLEGRQVIVTEPYERLTDQALQNVFGVAGRKRLPSSVGTQIEELIEGYVLLNTGGSHLIDILYRLRNLDRITSYHVMRILERSHLEALSLYGHFMAFNPDRTLYINDFAVIHDFNSNSQVEHVVYADGIEVVPKGAFERVGSLAFDHLRLPISIRVIRTEAFSGLDPEIELSTYDAADMLVEKDAMTYPYGNETLYELQGNHVVYELSFSVRPGISMTRYYDGPDDDDYLGKAIRHFYGEIEIYDEQDLIIGINDGTSIYDPDENVIENGPVHDRMFDYMNKFESAYRHQTEIFNDLSYYIEGDSIPLDLSIRTKHVETSETETSMTYRVRLYDYQGRLIAIGKTSVTDSPLIGIRDTLD